MGWRQDCQGQDGTSAFDHLLDLFLRSLNLSQPLLCSLQLSTCRREVVAKLLLDLDLLLVELLSVFRRLKCSLLLIEVLD